MKTKYFSDNQKIIRILSIPLSLERRVFFIINFEKFLQAPQIYVRRTAYFPFTFYNVMSTETLREKCPFSEFFWSLFSHIQTGYG